MNQETIFKILIFSGFTFGWLVRIYFTKQSKQGTVVKSVNAKRENLALKLGNLVFAMPLLYLLTDWLEFAQLGLPFWVRWVGVALIILGDAVFYLAHSALGRNWSDTLDIQAGHSLVKHGIYKYIRHPMYLGFLLFVLGIPIAADNGLLALVMIAWFIYMYQGRVRHEEQMMVEEFGEQYIAYMATTGRIFPKF